MVTPLKENETKQGSALGCLTRMGWMGMGNLALIISAISISRHKGNFLSFADLAFWMVVIILIPVRYVDIIKFGGLTATGKPAGMPQWRKYILILGLCSLGIWGAAHLIAY